MDRPGWLPVELCTERDERTVIGRMTIAGRSVACSDLIEVENPARAQPFARAPQASDADIDAAVTAAADAGDDWAWIGEKERGGLLRGRALLPSGRASG